MERVINNPNCSLGCKHHPASFGPQKQLAYKDGYVGCPAVPKDRDNKAVWDEIYHAHEAATAKDDGLVTPYQAEEIEPGWIFCHYRCPVHEGCEWTMGWAKGWAPDLAVYI